jgi:protein CpxP
MKLFKCMAMVLLWVFTTAVMAQKPKGERLAQKQEMREKRFAEFCEKVGIQENQKEKIKHLLKEQQEQLHKERKNPDHTPESKKAAMKNILKNTDIRIDALLSDEQKKKYTAYKLERKKEMKMKAEEKRKEKEELQEDGLFLND